MACIIEKVIIDDFCILYKEEEVIKIDFKWKRTANGSLLFLIIFMIFSIICAIILPFYISDNLKFYSQLIASLVLLGISLAFLPSFLYYRKRITRWIINTSSKKVLYNKVNPTFKNLKSIDFKDILYLDIRLERKIGLSALMDYTLHICLKSPTAKLVQIYHRTKYNCSKLGTILSHFMEKSLYEDRFKIINY